jgi:hypothetical protein
MPMFPCMPVLIGLRFNESLIILLFSPKLKLEPPIKIIRGGGTFCKRESLLIFENNKDFDSLGVGGRNVLTININANMEIKRSDFNKNFFIAELKIGNK